MAMTKPKTVILWGQDDLLAQAMEIFLTNAESWAVVRMSANQDICALVEQVQRIKPDLLILCQGKFENNSDPLVKWIHDQPELRVIINQQHLRVITVNPENNLMQVYSKHSLTLRKASDLLSIVEDRYFSDHPMEKEVIPGKTNE